MNPKLHHIALKVLDMGRCEKFYSGVLGLEIMQRHMEENGKIRSLWFDLGGTILMLERCEGLPPPAADMTSPVGWHLLALSISSSSRSEWRERLQRAGVTMTRETEYSMYFRDPENNLLAVSHYPEPEPSV